MNNFLLQINDLSVMVGDVVILNKINVAIMPGTIHVLMGPNGAGKSTLAYTIMGHPRYHVNNGSIYFKNGDITQLSPDKRARCGLFLSFQNSSEIPGVSVFSLLKESYQVVTGNHIAVQDFQALVHKKIAFLNLDPSILSRTLDGFSGGEKKRLELLQLLILNPTLAILDEIDSGLDVNGLACIAQSITELREIQPDMSIILITHYQRLLDVIKPDYVHVLVHGSLAASGNISLAHEIEHGGYNAFIRGSHAL